MNLSGAELATVSNTAITRNKLEYFRSQDQKTSHHGILSIMTSDFKNGVFLSKIQSIANWRLTSIVC